MVFDPGVGGNNSGVVCDRLPEALKLNRDEKAVLRLMQPNERYSIDELYHFVEEGLDLCSVVGRLVSTGLVAQNADGQYWLSNKYVERL